MTAENLPPSSNSAPDTASARGVVRDALGGFRNLLGLLRSIRVGPQAVGAVIPDVRASCAPMIRALESLLGDLSGEPSTCREGLTKFLLPEAEALEAALGKVRGGALRAKDRLNLEKALARGVQNLEIGARLLSLLHATRHGRPVPVDVAELVAQEEALVLASPPATRILPLSVPPSGTIVVIDPGVAAATLAVAAGLAAHKAKTDALSLAVTVLDERCTLRLGPAPAGDDAGSSATLTVLEPIGPTETCLRAAATACGCSVRVGPTYVELVVPVGSLA